MKILIGFVVGVLCGAAAMFYVPRQLASMSGGSTVVADAPGRADTGREDHAVAPPQTLPPVPTQAVPAHSISPRHVTVPDLAVTDSTMRPLDAPVLAERAQQTSSALNGLLIPVVGVAPGDLTDTFTQARGRGRVHDAIDIMAPRGTPVVAANDGHVVKLFTSERGGLTVYQFDPDDRVVYYYAHLDRYAAGLTEGQTLRRGDRVGFVGSTGNARDDAPHLHFEIEMLGPEKQWWHATSINPYGRFEGQQAAAETHPNSR